MYYLILFQKFFRFFLLLNIIFLFFSRSQADSRIWVSVDAGTNSSLHAVATTSPEFVVVAGDHGTLRKYDGSTWEEVPGWKAFASTDKRWRDAKELRALSIDEAGNIHVASYDAHNGCYAIWDAKSSSWSTLNTGTSRRITCLWCSKTSGVSVLTRISSYINVFSLNAKGKLTKLPTSPDETTLWGVHGDDKGNIWAVGGENILRSQNSGANWEGIPVPSGDGEKRSWLAVYALDENHVWFAGAKGSVAFWDGESISTSLHGQATLRGVYAKDASNIWIVGDQGTAYHFNGHEWTMLDLGTTADLKAISGTGDHLWVVGAKGTVLTRK